MSIKHHPTDAMLFAYGGGNLGEGLALVVATHIARCVLCREKIAAIETVGGALIEELPAVSMADDALTRTLIRLGTIEEKPAPRAIIPASDTRLVLPSPLHPYLGKTLPADRWRRLAPGIRHIDVLPRGKDGVKVELICVAPGMSLPLHGHSGRELTTVLSGSFSDELGNFGPGDFAELDGEVRHQPLSDTGEDCICLIAIEGPLKFSSVVARLLQVFTGF